MAQTLLQHLLTDNEVEEAASAVDAAAVLVAGDGEAVEDNWKMIAAADVHIQKGTVCLGKCTEVER